MEVAAVVVAASFPLPMRCLEVADVFVIGLAAAVAVLEAGWVRFAAACSSHWAHSEGRGVTGAPSLVIAGH